MGKRNFFPEVEKSIKLLFLHNISLKDSDSKDSVVTKVVTGTFWLDSTGLKLLEQTIGANSQTTEWPNWLGKCFSGRRLKKIGSLSESSITRLLEPYIQSHST